MKNLTFQQIESNIIKSRIVTEDNLRKQLAYAYHIFDHYGWCDLMITHLSVRVPNEEALLIIPFGLTFNEITPDNLVKVDFNGNILISKLGFSINQNGTMVHRAIYSQCPEINCIFHTHSAYGVAVSNQDEELLLLDQIAMMFHNKIGYHEFKTLFINDSQQSQLIKDARNKNAVILKNHGLITFGSNITDAFWFHYYLEATCKLHILSRSTGVKLAQPEPAIIESTAAKYETWRKKNEHVAVSDSELLFDAAKRKIGYIFD
ncbi:MAG: class II aldolase/adducin family protein [Burkholderiales bacterium]|jgi:ribulose-5-phosphate 4-epimerase/fuculose-1-phosphate aldolase|nr:class II aldolase/adducin family protein [Burkholderiales bacterium]